MWNSLAWALAAGAFVVAAVTSYREIHFNIPNDLRSPAMLSVNALLAALVAMGFAWKEKSARGWNLMQVCLRYGLWSAAAFRILPPMLNEDVLYLKNCGTFDAPYVLLGACVHGGLTWVMTFPFAIKVLERATWENDERLSEMCGAVVLVFFITACFVRLVLAEHWWRS